MSEDAKDYGLNITPHLSPEGKKLYLMSESDFYPKYDTIVWQKDNYGNETRGLVEGKYFCYVIRVIEGESWVAFHAFADTRVNHSWGEVFKTIDLEEIHALCQKELTDFNQWIEDYLDGKTTRLWKSAGINSELSREGLNN